MEERRLHLLTARRDSGRRGRPEQGRCDQRLRAARLRHAEGAAVDRRETEADRQTGESGERFSRLLRERGGGERNTYPRVGRGRLRKKEGRPRLRSRWQPAGRPVFDFVTPHARSVPDRGEWPTVVRLNLRT